MVTGAETARARVGCGGGDAAAVLGLMTGLDDLDDELLGLLGAQKVWDVVGN